MFFPASCIKLLLLFPDFFRTVAAIVSAACAASLMIFNHPSDGKSYNHDENDKQKNTLKIHHNTPRIKVPIVCTKNATTQAITH